MRRLREPANAPDKTPTEALTFCGATKGRALRARQAMDIEDEKKKLKRQPADGYHSLVRQHAVRKQLTQRSVVVPEARSRIWPRVFWRSSGCLMHSDVRPMSSSQPSQQLSLHGTSAHPTLGSLRPIEYRESLGLTA